jgi:hypothetical protein
MATGAMVKATLSKAVKTVNIGDALNVVGGVSDYKHAREQGNNPAVSLAKSIGSFAFYEMMGAWSIPLIGAQVVGSLVPAFGEHTAKSMNQRYRGAGKFGSGYFNMTSAGYTMRQRSLNAIHNNGLNTQSTLGNEARTYFRSSL